MIEKKKPGRPRKVVELAPEIQEPTSEEVLSSIGIGLPEVQVSGVGTVGEIPSIVVPETLQNAPEGVKTPHRYVAEVRRPNDVPEAFRDAEYNVDMGKVDAFLQRCADIGTNPVINGCMISERIL